MVRESSPRRDGGQLCAQSPLGQMLTARTMQDPESKEGNGTVDVSEADPPAGTVTVCLSEG